MVWSSTIAMMRRRPSQRGHSSTSVSKVRRIRVAQSTREDAATSAPDWSRSQWRINNTFGASCCVWGTSAAGAVCGVDGCCFDSAPRVSDDCAQVGSRWWGCVGEQDSLFVVAREHAVYDHHVKMDVQVQAAAKRCTNVIAPNSFAPRPTPRAQVRYRLDKSNGSERTHWRTGTDGMMRSTTCAAVLLIRRPAQLGHNPRPLHENAMSKS